MAMSANEVKILSTVLKATGTGTGLTETHESLIGSE